MNDLFKSQVVLELEKDKSWHNAEQFRRAMEAKYGFTPDNSIYLKIVNYQIEKYGTSLNYGNSGRPKKVSRKQRITRNEINRRRYETNRFIERIEQYEKENMVHTRKAS